MNIIYQNIIVYSLFCIIGLVAIGYGLVKKTKREIPLILGFSSIIAIFVYTITVNPDFANSMSALSTIALALFAGVTLFIHFQTMKDARDKENRDRKERSLNEVIGWSQDSLNALSSIKVTLFTVVDIKSHDEYTLEDFDRLIDITTRSIRIKKIIENLDSGLVKKTYQVIDDINQFVASISNNTLPTNYRDTVESLKQSIREVIEVASVF